MREQKMNKKTLAQKASVSISFLSDITNDKANPSLSIMEALAKALNTPLPTLLEATDLDDNALASLTGGNKAKPLPHGYMHVSAVLTEPQAYRVLRWNADNKKSLEQARKKSKKKGPETPPSES